MKKLKILSLLIVMIICLTVIFAACYNESNSDGGGRVENGTGGSSSVPVTVMPTSVSLSKSSIKLTRTEKTATLSATVYPSNAANKTITWSTSDSKVATVNNGTVTWVGKGTATITAKTSNNLTASCSVECGADAYNLIKRKINVELGGKYKSKKLYDSFFTNGFDITVSIESATDAMDEHIKIAFFAYGTQTAMLSYRFYYDTDKPVSVDLSTMVSGSLLNCLGGCDRLKDNIKVSSVISISGSGNVVVWKPTDSLYMSTVSTTQLFIDKTATWLESLVQVLTGEECTLNDLHK